MTAIAILATTTALLGWLLYRQHGKTRQAKAESLILAVRAGDADILECKLEDALYRATGAEAERDEARAAAHLASSLAYKSAVAAEKAERQLERATSTAAAAIVDLDGRALPQVPLPTADQSIAAKPWTGDAIVLTLPPIGGAAAVVPIKRAAVKKGGRGS